MLPNEPQLRVSSEQQALTESYLLPAQDELESFFLAIRLKVEPALKAAKPRKLGKQFPLGQCLEITKSVERLLPHWHPDDLSAPAAAGYQAYWAFRKGGGTFRQVWGDLRGKFFQNAFQLGSLYVDVSNDTVTPTKPKVEILPFSESGMVPIADFYHFERIARAYWGDQTYPNHLLPALAPYCPLIHLRPNGRLMLHALASYPVGLIRQGKFAPSESYLAQSTMPDTVFAQARQAFASIGMEVPATPAQGRLLALQACRVYRSKRWYSSQVQSARIIQRARQVNSQLAALAPMLPGGL